MILLKCDEPNRIRNKYTGQWMYVNCRKCPSCLVNQVNTRCLHLSKELAKFPFHLFATLTYDNDNLPFMVVGSRYIYRGVPTRNFPKIIGCVPELDLSTFVSRPPSGFPDGQMCGVLFYKDLSNFIKRLRINYERTTGKKFGWFYSCIGEYGTRSFRPHFHILFFGNEEFTEPFRDSVVESWKLHDWSKLPMEETIKFASEGVASYLSSYINSLSCVDAFLTQKGIKPKSFRSKNINFGVDSTLQKDFEKEVYTGMSYDSFKRNRGCFARWDTSKLNSFSLVVIPRKCVSAYFATPTNVCCAYSYNEYQCIRDLLHRVRKNRIRKEVIEPGDYRVWLAYKKYCLIRNLGFNEGSIMDFTLDSTLVNNYYKSLLLKQYMLTSDGDDRKHKENAYNTKVEDLDKRDYWCRMNGINYVDNVNTPNSYKELQNYKYNFRRKLLPKHLHGLINNGNNL